MRLRDRTPDRTCCIDLSVTDNLTTHHASVALLVDPIYLCALLCGISILGYPKFQFCILQHQIKTCSVSGVYTGDGRQRAAKIDVNTTDISQTDEDSAIVEDH